MQPVATRDLIKTYGPLRALDGVSLDIAGGELFCLLGPSGCGKTTLLRSIAGFVQPERGQILIGGADATNLPPQRRNTGMVFQSYALWPHLTVLENVAFGLRLRRLPRAEVKRQALAALAAVRMEDQAAKKPNQLSGGQQQRVALARALAIRPACLLLDEPLSNLDAKLRGEMRAEIRRICKESGLTAIYVTHDQKEALAIADRIAVMRAGRVVQIGEPIELYHHPASGFVADFLGQTNLLAGVYRGFDAGRAVVESPLGALRLTPPAAGLPAPGAPVTIAVRPESIAPRPLGEASVSFTARLQRRTFLGETVQVQLELNNPGAPPAALSALTLGGVGGSLHEGETATWWLDQDQAALLPPEPAAE
jgi:iron(III) transport system ATP-binding protein